MSGQAAVVALGVALALGACGGKGGDKAKLEGIRDRMCACNDKPCVVTVQKDVRELMTAMKDQYKTKDAVPKDLLALGEEIATCEQNARASERSKDTSEVMAKMSRFKDQMCACKDAACGDKVNDELVATMNELAKTPAETPSVDDVAKASKLMEDLAACQHKLAAQK